MEHMNNSFQSHFNAYATNVLHLHKHDLYTKSDNHNFQKRAKPFLALLLLNFITLVDTIVQSAHSIKNGKLSRLSKKFAIHQIM